MKDRAMGLAAQQRILIAGDYLAMVALELSAAQVFAKVLGF
jgi:hypothetical protein